MPPTIVDGKRCAISMPGYEYSKSRGGAVLAVTTTVAIVIAVYLCAAAALFFFQRSLLFVADKTVSTPAELKLSDTDVVALRTSDGVTLSAWLAHVATSGRLVIYFHGNGGSLAWRAASIYHWMQLGFSVLAVDYRGYGASEGSPSEVGFARDADAAYDYARGLGYRPSQIVLYGESLGSGVAVALAARRETGALVLDAPFTSIADVAAARYWMFPVRWLIRDPFRSDALIAKINVPILMMHGTADRVVPYRFGQALFALAGRNATFLDVPEAEHIVLGEESVQPRLRAWLAALPRARD